MDSKIPLESSYLHITQYHGIVEKHIRQSFKCFAFLDELGKPLLLCECPDGGFFHFGSFSSLLLFSSVLSVNALLTLLMPYVSGLVLFDRSLSHIHTKWGFAMHHQCFAESLYLKKKTNEKNEKKKRKKSSDPCSRNCLASSKLPTAKT